MDNSSRRGFFGQLLTGLTGCIFFPFFNKPKKRITDFAFKLESKPIEFPKPNKNDDIIFKTTYAQNPIKSIKGLTLADMVNYNLTTQNII